MNDPIQVGGGFSVCHNCGEEYHNSIAHDCSLNDSGTIPAPGGAVGEQYERAVENFQHHVYLAGIVEEGGERRRDGVVMIPDVAGAADDLRDAHVAAVRRAAEQGRREALEELSPKCPRCGQIFSMRPDPERLSHECPFELADWANAERLPPHGERTAMVRRGQCPKCHRYRMEGDASSGEHRNRCSKKYLDSGCGALFILPPLAALADEGRRT